MARVRGIVICLLSLVLVAAQATIAVQAGAMALEAPAAAAEAPATMADGGMSGDCEDCGTSDAGPGLCPANCCASCSTTAAVMPGEAADGAASAEARGVDVSRLLLGVSPSPHPTPPKHLVLS